MEYTEQQKQEFKNQYSIRRRRQLMVSVPLILVLIVFATANEGTGLVLGAIPINLLAPVFIIAIVGVLIFSLRNWRCPACNKYLGKTFNPKFCSKCGVSLRD
jgi:hypothetical protein